MSDDYSNDQPTGEGGLGQLRESARRGEQALKENDHLKKLLTFAKAGIDTDSELGAMLLQTWDGKADDIEGLKEKATRIGAIKALDAVTPPAPEVDPRRASEDDQRRQAYGDLPPGTPADPDAGLGPHPREQALRDFQEAQKRGIPTEEAQIDAFSAVIGAAMNGDRRVFFDADAHELEAQHANIASGQRRG
jgi:hypothetical protein